MRELRVSVLELLLDAQPIRNEGRQSGKRALTLQAGMRGKSTHS